LRFDLRYEPVLTQLCSSSVYGIMCWCVPLFLLLFYLLRVKKCTVECA
jgi:hypothetical protein